MVEIYFLEQFQSERKLPAPTAFPSSPSEVLNVISGREPIVTDDPAENPLQRLHHCYHRIKAGQEFRVPLERLSVRKSEMIQANSKPTFWERRRLFCPGSDQGDSGTVPSSTPLNI